MLRAERRDLACHFLCRSAEEGFNSEARLERRDIRQNISISFQGQGRYRQVVPKPVT